MTRSPISVPIAFVVLLLCARALPAQAPRTEGTAAAHTGKAVRLMQERHYSEAATEFEQALAADSSDDNVRIQYAICLYAQERNDDSRKQFEILRQRRGDWPGLQYYMGLLDFRAGDFASAIRRLQPLKTNPAFPKASFYIGLSYQSQEQTALALENLERAAKDNPRDPQVHYRLGRLYSLNDQAGDADREYKLYRDLDASQRLAEDYGTACMDALHSQPIALARVVCQQIVGVPVSESKDPARLTLLGRLYVQAGAFADAVEPLQRAVGLDPDSFDAWNYLGASLYSLRRYREAVEPLRKAADLNPQYFDTLNMLAATLHDVGDDAAALPVLERAHTLNPDDAGLTAALLKMRLAVTGKQ